MLFSPLKDSSIEMVFVKMTGENIDRFFLLQKRRNNTFQIQPLVKYQDGLFCFKDEATVEYVGQCHC